MMTTAWMTERTVSALRLFFSVILCAALVFYGYRSIHWQIIWDPSIMHYVNFLMAHGLAPYRDIIDINMPGSYFMDGWVMSVFGAGDLAWRIYEFCLLAVLIGSMIVIAWPYDWFAGLCAGALFAYSHATEGTRSAGQREELMTTLIVVGYACLLGALRKRKPALLLASGFALGLATSLKPTAALLVVLLPAMAAYALRREGVRVRTYLACAGAGFMAALLLDLQFFWRYHVFHDFIVVSGRLVAYYAALGNDPIKVLLKGLLTRPYWLLLFIGVVLAFLNVKRTRDQNIERYMLLLGVMFGAVSYLAQGKDFEHHLYTYFAMLLLWVSVEMARMWKSEGWQRRALGAACFAIVILPIVRRDTFGVLHIFPHEAQPIALEKDFDRLGGQAALQHEVLCFDMVGSCYSTLYRLKIMPYSNLVGDYMLFPPKGYAPVSYYREQLWDQLQQRKPRVIVLSTFWLCSPASFSKIDQWPQIVAYIQANYDVFSLVDSHYLAYKVYVRKSSVPATANAAQSTLPAVHVHGRSHHRQRASGPVTVSFYQPLMRQPFGDSTTV